MIKTVTYLHEQYQSTNDSLFLASNATSSFVTNMIPSSTFFMSFTNPMLDYAHPWIRLECNSEQKHIRTNYTRHQILELKKEFHYTNRAKWRNDNFKLCNDSHEASTTNPHLYAISTNDTSWSPISNVKKEYNINGNNK